jgi:very-short-patch-repair endonuclease
MRSRISLSRARVLRGQPTDAERRLWFFLRRRYVRGARFRRQVPIGPFIADFACLARRVVIELDGSQHAKDQAFDERRTQYLERQGFRVLRFWDNDVLLRTQSVLHRIWEELEVREFE